MEYKYYEGVGTQVVVGQGCNIGNRLEYSAISFKTGRFVSLEPDDICIFLGHEMQREPDRNYPNGLPYYNEIAVVERLDGKVKLAVGVLEPLQEVE